MSKNRKLLPGFIVVVGVILIVATSLLLNASPLVAALPILLGTGFTLVLAVVWLTSRDRDSGYAAVAIMLVTLLALPYALQRYERAVKLEQRLDQFRDEYSSAMADSTSVQTE